MGDAVDPYYLWDAGDRAAEVVQFDHCLERKSVVEVGGGSVATVNVAHRVPVVDGSIESSSLRKRNRADQGNLDVADVYGELEKDAMTDGSAN